MRTIISKAAPVGNNKTPDTTIEISAPLPEFDSIHENAEFFDREAESIFKHLTHSLPGGTLDRLIAKLLLYKATHFRVSHIIERK